MADLRGIFKYGRSLWPMIVYLIGCGALIIIVSNYFLIPALETVDQADPSQKRQLTAMSRLLLAVILMIVFVGMILVFRVRRFFYPHPSAKREKTQYIDAWAEAGRRARSTPAEEDEEEDDARQ